MTMKVRLKKPSVDVFFYKGPMLFDYKHAPDWVEQFTERSNSGLLVKSENHGHKLVRKPCMLIKEPGGKGALALSTERFDMLFEEVSDV